MCISVQRTSGPSFGILGWLCLWIEQVLAKLAAISKHCNSLLAQSITLQEAVDRLNDSTEASSTMSPEAKLLIAAAESTVRESSRIAQLLEDDCSAGANTLQHISHVHKQEKEQMHIDRVLSNPQLHMPSRRTKIFAQVRMCVATPQWRC